MKSEDKPLWVSVYEAFPPKYEPRFDRQLPRKKIAPIFYREDRIRAKFHRDQSFMPATDLATENVKSMTQRFLVTYKSIREKEKLEEDEAYEQALQQYNSEREARMESRKVGNETSRRL
ncbi:28S ribosomal protein S23, mitochondrial isoform X2 [Ooceraea biroi]|nr:28S ribosomal protein S23, mitochondrial isoform X2 [Ooceraea biroi]